LATVSREYNCGDLSQVIQFGDATRPDSEVIAMLAEKFILFLETLISHASDHKPHIVISTSPHIPIKLPKKQVSPKAAN
jgi:hypothetical protein